MLLAAAHTTRSPMLAVPGKILIVDDDPEIAQLLRIALRATGYQILTATRGEEALAMIATHDPATVLLDLMLPDLSGIEICRRVRASDRLTGIVIITAREDDYDRILGFEAGADDYLTKPPSLVELPYRVLALTRRIIEMRSQQPNTGAPPIEAGMLRIFVSKHQVFVGDDEVSLRPMEFCLLQELIMHRGVAFTREQLLQRVWQHDRRLGARTVDVHIRRLRVKLGRAAHLIETVPGVGYRFADVTPLLSHGRAL